MRPDVDIDRWGALEDGREVRRATLRTARGFEVQIGQLGATVTSVRAPDRDGVMDEVTLGFAAFADYRTAAYRSSRPCFGATLGRFANRIAGARFALDGVDHALAANEDGAQLHGGPDGFDERLWTLEPLSEATGVRLSLVSGHGDQGFPGELRVVVDVSVGSNADSDTLVLRYSAETDRPTHINLSNHTYFNLAGRQATTVEDHALTVFAEAFTPTDAAFLPTGEIARVDGLALDLRSGRRLGEILDSPELAMSRGLNQNYALPNGVTPTPRRVATLSEARHGRTLDVLTTQPGLQVYSGGFLPSLRGESGERFSRNAGIALEAQHFPDTPNQPAFPSTRLDPGQVFRSETRYCFSTESIHR